MDGFTQGRSCHMCSILFPLSHAYLCAPIGHVWPVCPRTDASKPVKDASKTVKDECVHQVFNTTQHNTTLEMRNLWLLFVMFPIVHGRLIARPGGPPSPLETSPATRTMSRPTPSSTPSPTTMTMTTSAAPTLSSSPATTTMMPKPLEPAVARDKLPTVSLPLGPPGPDPLDKPVPETTSKGDIGASSISTFRPGIPASTRTLLNETSTSLLNENYTGPQSQVCKIDYTKRLQKFKAHNNFRLGTASTWPQLQATGLPIMRRSASQTWTKSLLLL